jgi:hypothetical protein
MYRSPNRARSRQQALALRAARTSVISLAFEDEWARAIGVVGCPRLMSHVSGVDDTRAAKASWWSGLTAGVTPAGATATWGWSACRA